MKQIKLMQLSLLSSLTMVLLSACASVPSGPPSSSPSPSATASPSTGPTANPTATPSTPATALSQIGYGKSFGFCAGYCDHTLTVTAQTTRLVHKAFRDPEKNPERVVERPTTAATWQKLNSLANFQTLQSLPERIGCPDCADGGAEWVEMQQAQTVKRVTFEPQAGLPQQAELLAELKQLYAEIDAQDPVPR